MRVSYRELGPAQFRSAIRELLAVYSAAMNPPDRTLSGREAIMERHAASPGFRGLTAHDDGRLVGFCYGFHGENGQWWHDMVAAALGSRCGGTGSARRGLRAAHLARRLLRDRRAARAADVAGQRDRPLAAADNRRGRPERTAVLSTADAPTRARRLYRGVGFTDLLTDFRFSGGEPPYAVMGATLPLDASAAPRPARPSSW